MISIDEEVKWLLSDLKINKILIAERDPDHLAAAQEYFTMLHEQGTLVRFSMTEEDAKEKIRESFLEKDCYGLVISDYRLDGTENGLGVMREAMRHGIFGTLNLYEKTKDQKEPHNTHQAAPGREKETFTLGKKDPACWELMTYVSLLDLNRDYHMDTLIDTGMKVGGKPVFGDGNSRNFYKFMMRNYDLPLEEKAPIIDMAVERYKSAFYPDPARMVPRPKEEDQVRYIGGMRNMRPKHAH
jgi:hypothetical protein